MFDAMVASNVFKLKQWAARSVKSKVQTLTAVKESFSDLFLILEANKTDINLIPSKHFSSLTCFGW